MGSGAALPPLPGRAGGLDGGVAAGRLAGLIVFPRLVGEAADERRAANLHRAAGKLAALLAAKQQARQGRRPQRRWPDPPRPDKQAIEIEVRPVAGCLPARSACLVEHALRHPGRR
jgi:hypothetical protein